MKIVIKTKELRMNDLAQSATNEVAGGTLPEECSPANLLHQATQGAIGGALGGAATGSPAGALGGAVFGAALGAAFGAWGCANALGTSSAGSVAAAGAVDGGRASLSTGGTGGYLDSQ